MIWVNFPPLNKTKICTFSNPTGTESDLRRWRWCWTWARARRSDCTQITIVRSDIYKRVKPDNNHWRDLANQSCSTCTAEVEVLSLFRSPFSKSIHYLFTTEPQSINFKDSHASLQRWSADLQAQATEQLKSMTRFCPGGRSPWVNNNVFWSPTH